MISLTYDLHIHSCLSPCGDNDMTPANITGMAALLGLDVIAVTDHNSCKNCPAVMAAAKENQILAIPGMEINTAEEVHALCLFADLEGAMDFDAYVSRQLILFPNNEEIFGQQLVYDLNDQICASVPDLLINATSISFDSLEHLTAGYGGIMIPAHIDKSSNSLLANLGFIPPDSTFPAVEVKELKKLHGLQREHPYLAGCRIISNSDAHYLDAIHLPNLTIHTEERTIASIIRTLREKMDASSGF